MNCSKLRIAAVAAVLSISSASLTNALTYDSDRPLMFAYQNDSGSWYACGPLQCTHGGESSQFNALERVRYGEQPTELIGPYGRCSVYTDDAELQSYHFNQAG